MAAAAAVPDGGARIGATVPDEDGSSGVAAKRCVGNIAGSFDGGPTTFARLAARVVTEDTGRDGTVGIEATMPVFCAVDTMTVPNDVVGIRCGCWCSCCSCCCFSRLRSKLFSFVSSNNFCSIILILI